MHIVRIGDPAPDFSLPSLEGNCVRLSDYRGKRVLIFLWASWEVCREQLSGWDTFCRKYDSGKFSFISVAVDALGRDKVAPFVQAANPSFVTLVDTVEALWDLYGFEILPSGYYIDELGRVRYLKVGGFDVRDATTVKIVEDLLAEKWPKKPLKISEKSGPSARQEIEELTRQLRSPSLRGTDKRLRLAELFVEAGHVRKAAKEYDTVLAQHAKNVKALYARGVLYLREKKTLQTVACWKKASELVPSNWIIRKQTWAVEAPQQFYPAINYEWQQEQLRRQEFQASAVLKLKAKAQRR